MARAIEKDFLLYLIMYHPVSHLYQGASQDRSQPSVGKAVSKTRSASVPSQGIFGEKFTSTRNAVKAVIIRAGSQKSNTVRMVSNPLE